MLEHILDESISLYSKVTLPLPDLSKPIDFCYNAVIDLIKQETH